nr:hypothetical protein CFP56_62166 [Quercus suber]
MVSSRSGSTIEVSSKTRLQMRAQRRSGPSLPLQANPPIFLPITNECRVRPTPLDPALRCFSIELASSTCGNIPPAIVWFSFDAAMAILYSSRQKPFNIGGLRSHDTQLQWLSPRRLRGLWRFGETITLVNTDIQEGVGALFVGAQDITPAPARRALFMSQLILRFFGDRTRHTVYGYKRHRDMLGTGQPHSGDHLCRLLGLRRILGVIRTPGIRQAG